MFIIKGIKWDVRIFQIWMKNEKWSENKKYNL